MKKQILFKSALSLVAAAAAGSAFAAATSVLDEDFETFSADYAITNAPYWAADGADESKVAGDSSNKYLDLKTEGSTLERTLDQASTLNTALSGGTLTVDNPAVFSADVKFVPSDSLVSGLPEGTDDTKFAIYAYAADGGNTTNLVVYHASMVGQNLVYTNDIIASATVDPDKFTTVTVKMFADGDIAEDTLFFTVDFDGVSVSPTLADGDGEPTWFRAVNRPTAANCAFSTICFKGTGAVDDLKVDLGEDEVDSWVARLGDPVDGAYLIDDEAELISFQQGVAAGLTTAGTTFKLTADIALTAAWPGIGTYDNTTNADAFQGVFNGAGHTISNVVFADNLPAGGDSGSSVNNYRGFFNQVYNATIQNLTVEWVGWVANLGTTEFGGAALVGCANNATLQGLTAIGTITAGTHNNAGIVVRASGLTSATTISACTNKMAITGNYTKVGGICAITQSGTSTVTFDACVNEGAITAVKTQSAANAGRDGLAGILAYAANGDGKTIINACVNAGTIDGTAGFSGDHSGYTGAKAGQLLGWANNSASLTGANTVKDDYLAVGAYSSGKTSGQNFATVSGTTATMLADNDVVAGATQYKAMTEKAAFVFTAAGTLIVDEALKTAAVSVSDPTALEITTSTSGTVKTYTAAAPAPAGFDGGEEGTTFSIASDKQTALEDNLPEGVASLEAIADADSNLTYAQAYALGLWDENASEVAPLNAEITFDNQGRPQVEIADTARAAYDVTCKLYGSTSLPVSTSGTALAEGAPGTALVDNTASSDTAKFYKVVVVITDKQ